MKKYQGFLLASSVGVALAPGAQAADMPARVYKAPPAPAPVASWEGFYLGVHAGAAWQRGNNLPGSDSKGSPSTLDATSAIVGGQIGYNWRSGTNGLFGLEVDGSWLSGKGANHAGNNAYQAQTQNRIRWLGTARVRTGLVVGDTLAYVTAGVAFGGVKNCYACDFGSSAKSESKTRVGWTAGGGVEHMLSRNWTFGIEALFVDLGRKNVTAVGDSSKTTKFSNQAIIARAKLNYKF